MNAKHAVFTLATMFLAVMACVPPILGATRRISMNDLEDKVRGGWAGKMIGVSYGGPTEFRHLQQRNGERRHWRRDEIFDALDQDDLYVGMTFAKVMDDVGLDAISDQYGEALAKSTYRLWHGNLSARRSIRRGIPGSMSGDPGFNLHANDIDFQIESDFIGLMTPGMPRSAQRYAIRVGRVVGSGDGVYGGIFVAAMYSAAFFESNPEKIVTAGLAAIPPSSRYATVIRDVVRLHETYPGHWKIAWQRLEDAWDRDDVCPEGALRPLNINADLNGAYVVLALLYGKGRFERTMDIAMRSGQDSDSNPSTAAGIIGTAIGYRAIPEKWRSRVRRVADEKFTGVDASFNSMVASTILRAKKTARLEGGIATENFLMIPIQVPDELHLEEFDPGRVVERISSNDPRWIFTNHWSKGPEATTIEWRTDVSGAIALVTFSGTGAVLTGRLSAAGGSFDVYLDGKHVAAGDAYDESERDHEGLWGRFDLAPGSHILRVIVAARPFPRSKGTLVNIEDLIVFQR
jgi:hypothetical protein